MGDEDEAKIKVSGYQQPLWPEPVRWPDAAMSVCEPG
jgi:hypothetical protein